MSSLERASTVNKSYESFATELLNEEQPPLALAQSSMFPPDASTAGYHPSYTPREVFEQTVLSSQERWRFTGHDRHCWLFDWRGVRISLFSELGCYVVELYEVISFGGRG